MTRRTFTGGVIAGAGGVGISSRSAFGADAPAAAPDAAADTAERATVRLVVNDHEHVVEFDTRTTLLDALRGHLGITGPKKGCDHGQCGACTVFANGRRMNSCLSLTLMHEGDSITTIEGLADGETLAPMQAAFVANDGFQCGFCTPGQILSAIATLEEIEDGIPSAATDDLSGDPPVTDAEIRERMSGNLCRCSAYPNIVAAIRQARGETE